jgi:hypothetical protein
MSADHAARLHPSEEPKPAEADRVAQLEAELLQARQARDAALRDLAAEKARFSEHLLHCPNRSLPSVETMAGYLAESAPLRYRVVDAVNNGIKRQLPGVHGGLKALARTLRRSGG